MKYTLTSILTVFLCTVSLAQKGTKIYSPTDSKYWISVSETLSNERQKEFANLYIAKFEVTNKEYRTFISSLEKEKRQEFEPKNENWNKFFKNDEFKSDYYFLHAGFDDFPVVNVDYENAITYTKWLTEKYNQESKRDFKKVIIRIPTAEEWETAARGKNPDFVPYPWGGPYIKNRKGEYLANIKKIRPSVIKDTWDEDGNQQMEIVKKDDGKNIPLLPMQIAKTPVSPNGLYDLIGNVAEMTSCQHPDEPKALIAKGGSYALGEYWTPIDRNYPMQGASPFIGLRLVMEVIEE